jgi:hypothetical protein
VVLFVPRLLIFLEKLECGLFFGVRSEDQLLGNGGVLYLVRSGAVAWQVNKQVVFYFWSVLGLLLGNDNKPLPRERFYRVVPCGRFYRAVAPGKFLMSRWPRNVFTETSPRESIYRVVAPGRCFPSRCRGNVFTEPLPRERFYLVVALGT